MSTARLVVDAQIKVTGSHAGEQLWTSPSWIEPGSACKSRPTYAEKWLTVIMIRSISTELRLFLRNSTLPCPDNFNNQRRPTNAVLCSPRAIRRSPGTLHQGPNLTSHVYTVLRSPRAIRRSPATLHQGRNLTSHVYAVLCSPRAIRRSPATLHQGPKLTNHLCVSSV